MGGPPKEGPHQVRKREKIPLHDEADLVNYRADSLARLITNQDFLENVSLKPFHTSHIAPPSVFPTYIKNAYEKSATDEDVKTAAKNLKPEDIYIGDIRLMKAKQVLLGEKDDTESALTLGDITVDSRDSIFSEESSFQREAVDRLAKLREEHKDLNALAKLEDAADEILREYEAKFKKLHKLQQLRYRQHSIPIAELAPELDVQLAPPQYNPHLISSYLASIDDKPGSGLDGKAGPNGFDVPGGGGDGNSGLDANMGLNNGNNGANVLMGENGFEDFGLMLGGEGDDDDGRIGSRPGSSWSGAPLSAQTRPEQFMKNESLPYEQDYRKNGPGAYNDDPAVKMQESGQKPSMGGDSMVDLNQFLADGSGDDGIDEMDALIDFNPENGGGNGGDEPFGVDFLNDIGMDLN